MRQARFGHLKHETPIRYLNRGTHLKDVHTAVRAFENVIIGVIRMRSLGADQGWLRAVQDSPIAIHHINKALSWKIKLRDDVSN
ncbi:hypothetical protein D3C85_1443350 [compost metagenome]